MASGRVRSGFILSGLSVIQLWGRDGDPAADVSIDATWEKATLKEAPIDRPQRRPRGGRRAPAEAR